MPGYNIFARYYDDLTANIDYAERAAYFDEIIRKFKKTKGNILLDLACGTGSLSIEEAKLGYDVIGVDNSAEMLSRAVEKKISTGLPVQFLLQDMRSLDMFGTVDVTLCALDSLNHLGSLDEVIETFDSVHLFSEPDGLFVFDMNTPYKHRNILANNTFTYDTENVYCVWENYFSAENGNADNSADNDEDNKIRIELQFFELLENGLYARTGESFCERSYSGEKIEQALLKCGFEILAKYRGDTFDPPEKDTQRIVYVTRAIKEM